MNISHEDMVAIATVLSNSAALVSLRREVMTGSLRSSKVRILVKRARQAHVEWENALWALAECCRSAHIADVAYMAANRMDCDREVARRSLISLMNHGADMHLCVLKYSLMNLGYQLGNKKDATYYGSAIEKLLTRSQKWKRSRRALVAAVWHWKCMMVDWPLLPIQDYEQRVRRLASVMKKTRSHDILFLYCCGIEQALMSFLHNPDWLKGSEKLRRMLSTVYPVYYAACKRIENRPLRIDDQWVAALKGH